MFLCSGLPPGSDEQTSDHAVVAAENAEALGLPG